jgi:dTDP-4-dehydrorhamnose 3,5-epimerase
MRVVKTAIPDVMILEPTVHSDPRGLFFESYNKRALKQLAGVDREFVQDNHSRSVRGVLRGLHYQIEHPQGKLVRVLSGTVYDVAVDIRRSSPTFGRWVAVELSAENRRIVWIPEGFAHGFLVLSEVADFAYKVTDYYSPAGERTIIWNDPTLAIDWPEMDGRPVVSAKDLAAPRLVDAEVFS